MSDPTSTWRHAAAVRWLRAQPEQRRHTLVAAVFALVAAVWAPLGVLAFLTQSTTAFVVCTALAVAVLLAPRPVLAEETARRHTSAVATWLRDGLRRDLARVGAWAQRLADRALERRDARQPNSSTASS